MLPPSGDQFEIAAGGYRAVITESGGALRLLEHQGRPLVDGFGEDEMSGGGRGQQLVPWPNRTRDGRYSFEGSDHQLPLTEPKRTNASHGLARWVAWSVEEHTPHSVSLQYRLMAQTGYPWTLDLHVVYDLSADGLTVTQTATNMSGARAPYAVGAHPYLCVGDGPVDGLELTFPGSTRYLVDAERLLPEGSEPVDGTEYDFRVSRPLRGTVLNDTFTDLARDERDVATATLLDPASGRGVSLWVDAKYPCLLLYTADDVPATARRSLAIEPMSAPPDALNSGTDLVVLEPAGEAGDEHSGCWGIRAVD
ncbi:aldose 1-epimerase family protein [Nocardioides bruguierae]|uniref:Aldose 1-epimerase family protein n=1 Tax=Nocardioides bruguierae TaxID=2945102 RepID=A0A9X2DCV8_9ACTN|nr:aldose 1-epimerase family protein [Nocardioides bruguierae]MCL8027521.1 aldose 1-epimerase family protein [Nocardioides bruguierae]MCM0622154.1 aldose 1-epimerase family protein [Nocardioides bruguierae]